MTWQVEVSDGSVRCGRMSGDGAVPILLVPGRGDSLELRAAVARRLSIGASEVVMPELRGQGGSGHLGRHHDAVHIDDFERHLGDLRAVVDRLDGPAHLVAHSMGGLLAAHLLAEFPDRFRTAAISSPMWRFTQPLGVVRPMAAAAVAAGRGTAFAAGEGPFDIRTCVAMRTGRPGPTAEGELERFADEHRNLVRGGSTWGWVAAAARCMRGLDTIPLDRFTGPVVVGSCRDDRTVSRSAHHRVAQRFRCARLVELAGGHDPFVADGAVGWWTVIEGLHRGDPEWNC